MDNKFKTIMNMDCQSDNESLASSQTKQDSSPLFTLSSMQLNFLVVLILAGVNAVLALVYAYIKYWSKRKTRSGHVNHASSHVINQDGRPHQVRRQSSVKLEQSSWKYSRRSTSTHIVLNAGKKKESLRRISSNFL